MKIKKTNMSVGEVAKRSGVNISALHFYEEKGLIHAVRNAGNQRRYNRDVLRRIAVIKAAQKTGITLESIKNAMAFLPKDKAPTKSDWEKLSKQWKHELDNRIDQFFTSQNRNSCKRFVSCQFSVELV